MESGNEYDVQVLPVVQCTRNQDSTTFPTRCHIYTWQLAAQY